MPASPYQEPEPARATASSVLLFPPVSSFSATIRRRFSHRPRRFVDRPGRSVPLSASPNDRPVATIPRPELTTDYLAVFVVLVVVQTHRERVATPVYVHEPRRSPSQSRRHSVPPRITRFLFTYTLATYVRREPTDQLCVMTQGRQVSPLRPHPSHTAARAAANSHPLHVALSSAHARANTVALSRSLSQSRDCFMSYARVTRRKSARLLFYR